MQTGAQGYWAEIILIAGLVVYVMNLVLGKTKNSRIVRWWAAANWRLLERELALVGDDGKQKDLPASDEAASGSGSAAGSSNGTGGELDEEAEPDADSLPAGLIKESESFYRVWCSGRVRVESLVVELRLLKRHDLFSVCSYLIKPQDDQIVSSRAFYTYYSHTEYEYSYISSNSIYLSHFISNLLICILCIFNRFRYTELLWMMTKWKHLLLPRVTSDPQLNCKRITMIWYKTLDY